MRALFGGLIVFSTLCLAAEPEPGTPRLDPTYGVRGIAQLWPSAKGGKKLGQAQASPAAAIDSAGRIFSIVWTGGWNRSMTSVLATLPDGRADETFGVRGVVDLSRVAVLWSLDVDSHGRPVLAGRGPSTSARPDGQPVLVRLTRTGALDEDFGIGGVAVVGEPTDSSPSIAAIPDGSDSWLVAVERPVPLSFGGPPYGTMARQVLRIDAAGAIDASYRGALPNSASPRNNSDIRPILSIAAADAAGRAYLTEQTNFYGRPDPRFALAVTRLTAAGDVDATFGENGTTTFEFDGSTYVNGTEIDSLGRVVLLLRYPRPSIVRLTPDGAPDPAWGPNGDGVAPVPGPPTFSAQAFALRGDRYVVAGLTFGARREGDTTIQIRSMAASGESPPLILTFPRRAFRGRLDGNPTCVLHGDSLVVGAVASVSRGRRRAPFLARIAFE